MAIHYAKPLARLVSEFEKLPGIGPKSAQRLAFHVLRLPEEDARSLAAAIGEIKSLIRFCTLCGNFTDSELCDICMDRRRDQGILCVVAEPRDLIAMEKTNSVAGTMYCMALSARSTELGRISCAFTSSRTGLVMGLFAR
jgi:recombination protein RecR